MDHRGDKDPESSLAALLREIRLQAGQSIKQAGPQLGVNYSYLSKIENGVVAPSADLLDRMASVYGADVDALYVAAKRLPPDVVQILREHFSEAIALLRRRFRSEF